MRAVLMSAYNTRAISAILTQILCQVGFDEMDEKGGIF